MGQCQHDRMVQRQFDLFPALRRFEFLSSPSIVPSLLQPGRPLTRFGFPFSSLKKLLHVHLPTSKTKTRENDSLRVSLQRPLTSFQHRLNIFYPRSFAFLFLLVLLSFLGIPISCSAFSYDYIVIGSGSAGSVVASRLAQHNYQTLLIEAGGESEPLTTCDFYNEHTHQFQTWQYPTKFHDKRTFINNPKEWRDKVVHGKVAGGTSIVNSCLFTPAGLREFEHLGYQWNATAFAEAYLYLQKELPVVHKQFRNGIYTEIVLLKLIEKGLFNFVHEKEESKERVVDQNVDVLEDPHEQREDRGKAVAQTSPTGDEEEKAVGDVTIGLKEDEVVDSETGSRRKQLTSASIKSRATHLLDHSGYRRGWWLTTDENYRRRTTYDSLVTQKALPNLDVWLNATVTRILFDKDEK
ncbi:unnamed protein product, partial [Amoebophrya sp. A25]|eukprot:GSA25T00004626001.1